MEFSIKSTSPEKLRTDCLLVGIYEGKKLTDLAKSLDAVSEKAISAALKSGDMEGKAGSTLMLRQLAGVMASRVMLVGLGKTDEVTLKSVRNSFRAALKALPTGVENVATDFSSLTLKKITVQQKAAALAEVALDAAYKVNAIKAKSVEPHPLKQVLLLADKADVAAA